MHAHTHMLSQTDYMHFTIPQSYRCPRVLWTYTWLWSPHFLALGLDAFGGAEGLRKKGVGQEERDEDRDRRGRSRREGGSGEIEKGVEWGGEEGKEGVRREKRKWGGEEGKESDAGRRYREGYSGVTGGGRCSMSVKYTKISIPITVKCG